MRRVESIQILRFLAASLVVIGHCASGYFAVGSVGVDIFFVVSGFIITKVLPQRTVREFITDRVTRIYPIYWVFALPMTLLLWDGDRARLLATGSLWPLWPDFHRSYLAVGWTLHFELLFYAGAALVLWRRYLFLPLVGLYGLALCLNMIGGGSLAGFVGSTMVFEFFMGVALATLRPTRAVRTGAVAMILSALAIVLVARPEFGIIENMFDGGAWQRPLLWGVPAALIVWGGLQFEGWLKTTPWRLLSRGGDSSYALYLSHPLFLAIAAPTNPYVLLLLGPPVLIALGFAAHSWIEKPLLLGTRRLLEPRGREALE